MDRGPFHRMAAVGASIGVEGPLCRVYCLKGLGLPSYHSETVRSFGFRVAHTHTDFLPLSPQRAQYPLIKEYGLNYIGLHIMI